MLHLTGIVIHVWAENNSSPALNAPFSNETTTNNFQTEKRKGSSLPIFEIKTDSFQGQTHLPFAVRGSLVGMLVFPKLLSKKTMYTKICKSFKWINVKRMLSQFHSFLVQIVE